jgi:DNA-binding winged helix-turn-helix (wHTH) protein
MDMLAGAPSQSALGQAYLSPVVLAHEPSFRIGRAELRPSTRQVLFDQQSSIVEPRVMQLIVALHRAKGEVVSKDDLADFCWQGRIVGEDAINRVVSRARSVADKQAGGQFRIETITKVGYRLIANENSDGVADKREPHSVRTKLGRRELVLGSAALAVAGAVGAAWTVSQAGRTPHEAQLLIDGARKSLRQGELDAPVNAIGTLRRGRNRTK